MVPTLVIAAFLASLVLARSWKSAILYGALAPVAIVGVFWAPSLLGYASHHGARQGASAFAFAGFVGLQLAFAGAIIGLIAYGLRRLFNR